MIVPDSNLLLYAYDSTSPFHGKAREWWEGCLSGDETVGLTHPVLFAFIRIATSTRAFARPLALDRAAMIVSSWVDRPCTRVLLPDDRHISQVLQCLAIAASAGGNFVTDAQIAALAISHRAVVHTADRDFMRFRGLTVHFPLD